MKHLNMSYMALVLTLTLDNTQKDKQCDRNEKWNAIVQFRFAHICIIHLFLLKIPFYFKVQQPKTKMFDLEAVQRQKICMNRRRKRREKK